MFCFVLRALLCVVVARVSWCGVHQKSLLRWPSILPSPSSRARRTATSRSAASASCAALRPRSAPALALSWPTAARGRLSRDPYPPERALTSPLFAHLLQVLRPPPPPHDELPQEEVRPLEPAPTEEEAPLIVAMVSGAAAWTLHPLLFCCVVSGQWLAHATARRRGHEADRCQ